MARAGPSGTQHLGYSACKVIVYDCTDAHSQAHEAWLRRIRGSRVQDQNRSWSGLLSPSFGVAKLVMRERDALHLALVNLEWSSGTT